MTGVREVPAPELTVEVVGEHEVHVESTAGVGALAVEVLGENEVLVESQGLPGPPGQTAEVLVFSQPGPLQVVRGRARLYVEVDCQLVSARASVGAAAPDGSVVVAVRRNDQVLLTVQVPALSFSAAAAGVPVRLAAGDWLACDVAVAGGPLAPASDLTVVLRTLR